MSDLLLVDAKIIERVERGALLLDVERPGWAEKIDLGRFYIDSCFECVLGQLYGEYGDGLDELKTINREVWIHPERFGFDCGQAPINPRDQKSLYADLQTAWCAEIRKRKSATPAERKLNVEIVL
jgi:hypothetical protein